MQGRKVGLSACRVAANQKTSSTSSVTKRKKPAAILIDEVGSKGNWKEAWIREIPPFSLSLSMDDEAKFASRQTSAIVVKSVATESVTLCDYLVAGKREGIEGAYRDRGETRNRRRRRS